MRGSQVGRRPTKQEPTDTSVSQLEGEGLDPVDPELAPRTRIVDPAQLEPAKSYVPDAEDQNATRAGPPFRLEVDEGPDAGKTVRFKSVRMVVGRSANIEFQLTDDSVSRKHLELVHSDAGVLLRDLGSGNGTKVNGEKVAERKLVHGDVIALGNTRIRFIDEKVEHERALKGEDQDAEGATDDLPEEGVDGGSLEALSADARAPVAEPPPEVPAELPLKRSPTTVGEKIKVMPPVAKLLAVVLVAVAVVIGVGIALKPKPPEKEDTRVADAKLRIESARQAVREKRLADAVSLLEEAERLHPGADRTGQLPKVREELKTQEGIAAVRALIAKAVAAKDEVAEASVRFSDADVAFAALPVDTVNFEEDRRQLEQELKESKTSFYTDRLNEHLGAGDLAQARKMLEKIPVERQSEPAARIADFERQLAAADREERVEGARAAARAKAAAAAKRREDIELAFAVVERKFISGEWERAASECSRVIDGNPTDPEIIDRAKLLKGTIPQFGKVYDEGVKKHRAKHYASAAKPLMEAYRTLKVIDLPANRYAEDLRQMLIDSLIARGNESLSRDDLLEALNAFRAVLKDLDPDHPRAKSGVLEIESRCNELFMQGYALKDEQAPRALKMFKLVVELCSTNQELQTRALTQIQSLQQ